MSETKTNNTNIENEHIPPAYITDNDTGMKYELDFCRESVKFAENRGFTLEDAIKFPVNGINDLFYYAFRKNHRSMPREKSDKLLEKAGGMSEGLLTRLIQLYQQAQTYNTIQSDEDAEKNVHVTLEL